MAPSAQCVVFSPWKINRGPSPHLGTTLETPLPPYRLVKISWKSVQPFPRTVVCFFCGGQKKKQKTKKKQKKTSVKHIRIRLIGGCVKQWLSLRASSSDSCRYFHVKLYSASNRRSCSRRLSMFSVSNHADNRKTTPSLGRFGYFPHQFIYIMLRIKC